MQDSRVVQKNYEPELINVTRNPYLLDYEEQRRRPQQRRRAGQDTGRSAYGQAYGSRTAGAGRSQAAYSRETSRTSCPAGRPGEARAAYSRETGQARRPAGRPGEVQPIYGRDMRQGAGRPQAQSGRTGREAMLRERRRRQQRRQKIAVGIWAVCIIAISGVLLLNHNSASAAGSGSSSKNSQHQSQETPSNGSAPNVSGAVIQGLPAEKFTAHPEWTEDFLTPNEYSRPGEALPEVKDVFVHYTANPGTSAAQNRSYFEQQKDVHMASVSSHFIIGYEGEIIQCVPLDEIAYAVAGRNYDSVSIECCYTAQDGSFTKETYDSLIALLSWLTDVYDLDTSHILRHYDCGGKKCPIYYTENGDEWEQLKQDVKSYRK